jgi:CheY-like chemotaxis protein/two-component sensor histidine kinase
MSHELRTPLNAILGFGQLIARQNPSEVLHKRVGHILTAGRHLLNLINEVLDISRIEAGNLQFSLEPVSANESLNEALSLMRPLAAERKIELTMTGIGDEQHYVMADRQRIKQVLLNLLTNAVKYTPVEGQVTISIATSAGERVRIVVSDSGAGISEDKLPRLFIAFDRLGAENSAVEGTGLGLALCKRLMLAMHGQIGVQSDPGRGSTFWIELPSCPSPLARLGAEKRRDGSIFGDGSKRHRLLYIEDNASNLILVQEMVAELQGIELIVAKEGQAGFDLAISTQPDLVLLDLHLPDVPGWTVLSRLKADARTFHVPVLVISADATERQMKRLAAAGARGYLTKPIDADEFFTAVEQLLPAADAQPCATTSIL